MSPARHTKTTSGTRQSTSQKRSRVIKATEGGHNTVHTTKHERSVAAEGFVSPRTSALIQGRTAALSQSAMSTSVITNAKTHYVLKPVQSTQMMLEEVHTAPIQTVSSDCSALVAQLREDVIEELTEMQKN